jgi:hypothetical protein
MKKGQPMTPADEMPARMRNALLDCEAGPVQKAKVCKKEECHRG